MNLILLQNIYIFHYLGIWKIEKKVNISMYVDSYMYDVHVYPIAYNVI